jgi:hypothetical protein
LLNPVKFNFLSAYGHETYKARPSQFSDRTGKNAMQDSLFVVSLSLAHRGIIQKRNAISLIHTIESIGALHKGIQLTTSFIMPHITASLFAVSMLGTLFKSDSH